MIQPRASQKPILAYSGGKMGVSAVPGSGKTWTLTQLAIQLLTHNMLMEEQEVLIVTLTNSAANHFKARMDTWAREHKALSLLPRYCVRTLHGLAYEILRERPDLANLESSFQILDEHTCKTILNQASHRHLQPFFSLLEQHLKPNISESEIADVRMHKAVQLAYDLGINFMRTAKDKRLLPEQIQTLSDRYGLILPFLDIGLKIYQEYQRALAYYEGIDFDDLIRLALDVLEQDEKFLERLQYRWAYILEDESQDSSRLQEMILRKLTAAHGNWVRVGDPNQAIYESFTTASPNYLINFLKEEGVSAYNLDESSRSGLPIINLANHLIEWTQTNHPTPTVRNALTTPKIQPVSDNDPHPNPIAHPAAVKLIHTSFTPQQEIEAISSSIERWLPSHPQDTVAVLAATNHHANLLITELDKRNIPFNDILLKSSSKTHPLTDVLNSVLQYISQPQSNHKLAELYIKINTQPAFQKEKDTISSRIRRCPRLEAFLYPTPQDDWLNSLTDLAEEEKLSLIQFRENIHRWLGLFFLPIDQILIALSRDIFHEPHQLAMAHKLARELRRSQDMFPEWGIKDLIQEFGIIANNKENFSVFDDKRGFDPDIYSGQVMVSTIHKAKGLEWDRVYVMAVNNYDFPSGLEKDTYRSEMWYLREGLNPPAEAIRLLNTLISYDEYTAIPSMGEASSDARLEVIRERLRVLYVAITRARKELILTWNTGKRGNAEAAVPFMALEQFNSPPSDKLSNS